MSLQVSYQIMSGSFAGIRKMMACFWNVDWHSVGVILAGGRGQVIKEFNPIVKLVDNKMELISTLGIEGEIWM